MTREQAILFIDGSNFYHSARSIGIATGGLNYPAMAHKLVLDRNDVAYLLSADGDFVPVVEAVRLRRKKVFVASPVVGYELKRAADAFILLKSEWFSGLSDT